MPMTVDPLAHTPFSYEYNPQSLLTPYAYQQQLIDALVASVSIARSGDCLLIVLATGGGKNLVSNEFVANVIQEGKRVLRLTMNWELSAQRALTVTRALLAAGVPERSVFSAGFGASNPVAPNDTVENRARNRRVEIAPIPRPGPRK